MVCVGYLYWAAVSMGGFMIGRVYVWGTNVNDAGADRSSTPTNSFICADADTQVVEYASGPRTGFTSVCGTTL